MCQCASRWWVSTVCADLPPWRRSCVRRSRETATPWSCVKTRILTLTSSQVNWAPGTENIRRQQSTGSSHALSVIRNHGHLTGWLFQRALVSLWSQDTPLPCKAPSYPYFIRILHNTHRVYKTLGTLWLPMKQAEQVIPDKMFSVINYSADYFLD